MVHGLAVDILPGAERDKLELLQAGKMETITRGGQTYRRLVDNVRLKRGDAILTCELAEFFVDRDEAVLEGGVKIVTLTSELRGQTAHYWGEREYVEIVGDAFYSHSPYSITAGKLGYHMDIKEVVSTGDPVLIDSTSELSADTVFYYEADSLGDARGEAFLDNHGDSLTVAAQRLLYFAGRESLTASGESVLVKMDGVGDTTLRILSDSLSLEEDYFYAWQNVRLNHGGAVGTCGRAVYQQSDELAIMEEDPVLEESSFRLEGQQFNLHLDGGDLRSVFIPEQPLFNQERESADSVFTDWINGRQMAVEFEDGQARDVTVVGMATSYFNVIEDEEFQGANKVSGDTLYLLLSDSSLKEVTVTGGAEGVFRPATVADLDGPINYQSEYILYSIEDETTMLETDARIRYLDMGLSAGRVGVFWRENLLKSSSLTDTLGANDFPVLEQAGQEPFYGTHLLYDLSTRRGKVTAGRTRLEDGHYFGEELTRVTEDVYLMEDGYYTTCSIPEDPHFYFFSNRMKLITDKLIIARPVILYIADIPLLALPFAVFPQKKGRTSGFIMPSYDYRPNNGGRALKGLGYYWAISDFADAKFMMDYWDQYEEFNYHGLLRYKKRYFINGYVDGSMVSRRNNLLDPPSWSWKLKFNHQQTINPTFRITANGQLDGTGNFDRNYNHDQDQRLRTKLVSGVNISKKLESIDASLSANTRYEQDLQVTRKIQSPPVTEGERLTGPKLLFPGVSFSRSSKPLIKNAGSEDLWYHKLRWSYRSNLNNNRNWEYNSYATGDTTGGDTLAWEESYEDKHLWNHGIGLSANTSILKVLNVVGNVNYTDKWVFRYQEVQFDDNGYVITDSSGNFQTFERDGFLRRGTFSTSASFNTKIYGIFPVHLGALQAIRHTLTPRISLSYTPDFSTDSWGYIQRYTDSTGVEREFDPYALTSIGSTPGTRRLNLNYSLSNQFDYKLYRNEQETKGQFLTWNMGGGYNFEADSLKATDINSTIRLKLSDKLNLNLRARHEIYERDSTGTKKIDVFRSPRLTNAGFSFQFKLAGHAPVADPSQALLTLDSLGVMDTLAQEGPRQGSPPPKKRAEGTEVWRANLSFNYSLTHSNPLQDRVQSMQMNLNLNLNISPKWTIGYRGSFNVLEQRVLSQNINIGRDLHCWRLSFNWTPGGFYSGFNLLIQPKASQLRDLKLEHKSKRRFYP